VPKPARNLGIGVDTLPDKIRLSKVLTGNDLGMLANVEQIPDMDSVAIYKHMNKDLNKLHQAHIDDKFKLELLLHKMAQQLLENNKVQDAWKVLLS